MSLRARLTIAAAVAVAVAVLLSSIGGYFVVRNQLRDQVDQALIGRAEVIQHAPDFDERHHGFPSVPPADLGGASGYLQIVSVDGTVLRPSGADVAVPVTSRTRAVAAGSADAFFADANLSGTHVRVLTTPIGLGGALQLVRPLDEVDRVLGRLRWILLAVAAGGIALAAGLGALVSRTAIAPVTRLTETTEEVSSTLDLSRRIETAGTDEIGRLAASFNAMLAALESSVGAQRQLVADASHELRTPLTSLRVNIETLLRGHALAPDDRKRLGDDVVEQLGEMTALVDEVVEVARGEEQPAEREPVQLDEIVEECVVRARRNAPGLVFETDIEPCLVHGVPARLERAVGNLLDNASKWSPPLGTVEVAVARGEVVVRDHGPGFVEADLPYVFDRFFRSTDARSLPGSGLGLAIVQQVAEQHGGSVAAGNADGGGALLRLSLPVVEPSL